MLSDDSIDTPSLLQMISGNGIPSTTASSTAAFPSMTMRSERGLSIDGGAVKVIQKIFSKPGNHKKHQNYRQTGR